MVMRRRGRLSGGITAMIMIIIIARVITIPIVLLQVRIMVTVIHYHDNFLHKS